MVSMGERLVEEVQRFQAATGETGMTVVVEKAQQQIALHRIQFDPMFGLLVDGKPPSVNWFQEAEDYHPLQMKPQVLH